jgi:hypothetical protein
MGINEQQLMKFCIRVISNYDHLVKEPSGFWELTAELLSALQHDVSFASAMVPKLSSIGLSAQAVRWLKKHAPALEKTEPAKEAAVSRPLAIPSPNPVGIHFERDENMERGRVNQLHPVRDQVVASEVRGSGLRFSSPSPKFPL